MSEIDDVIKMLDNLTQDGVSRIKVETSGEVAEGERKQFSCGKRHTTTGAATWAALLPQENCLTRRSRTVAESDFFAGGKIGRDRIS